ncbi:MAG: UvrD-helicase domain-containing protein [Planctomycetes bacterium]|nr:UvrD-helicase domain-containing protein [Planctomycetota bacterium]
MTPTGTTGSGTGGAIAHRLVRASAGTGKTYQLTRHYLALIHAGVKPEHALATTFTRAAAGEILDRVLGVVARAAVDPERAEKLGAELHAARFGVADARSMLGVICRSLNRVSISTIDSFFTRVAGSFRLELGLPPNPDMRGEGDPEVDRVRVRAIEAMLADEEPQVLVDLLRRYHHDSAQRGVTESIERIVKSLYEVYREVPDEAAWRRIDAPEPPGRERLVEMTDGVRRLVEDGGAFGKKLAEAMAKVRGLAEHGDWEGVLAQKLVQSVSHGDGIYARAQVPEVVCDALRPLAEAAETLVRFGVAERGRAAYELVRRFSDHFDRLREREGLVLFSDLPLRLSMDLPELGDIYYRLDGRVHHLLLDEFQDTSLTQWHVLEPIAAEIASHAADAEHSFFCVGDSKQAIYGWRGGCAELFGHIERQLHLPPESRIRLSRSFRSAQVVLDAVNRVFGKLAENPVLSGMHGGVAAAWSEGYESHEAAKKLPGYVELVTSGSEGGEDESEEEEGEAEKEDRSLPTGHEWFVADLVERIMHDAPGRSIGVLVSRNEAARRIMHVLREKKIDASGEGGHYITDDPAVNAVLAALTLADHPGDRVARFHVSHSPIGAVLGMDSGADAAAARIRRALVERGYAAVIVDWARAVAPSCGAADVHRLTQLIELADGYDAGRSLRPSRFVEQVKAAQVEEPSASPVRVMTIHRSKGLEFDVVVLPELHCKVGDVGRAAAYVERESPVGPIRGVYPQVKRELRLLFPGIETAYAQTERSRMMDDLSSLYVAMTRARHALHMVVRPLKTKKDGTPSVKGWSNGQLDSILRRGLCGDEPDFSQGKKLYSAGDERWSSKLEEAVPAPAAFEAKPVSIRLARADRAARTLPIVSPSGLEGGGRVSVKDLLTQTAGAARERGTVMHAWFELVGFTDRDTLPTDDACIAAAARVVANPDPATVWLWLREFREMAARGEIADALRAPAGERAELWRERPFIVTLDGQLVRGQFDRVVVERRGGVAVGAQVLDFKTDRVEGAGLADRVEVYRPQVAAYRRALAVMLGLKEREVRARLLFVVPGRVMEVNHEV